MSGLGSMRRSPGSWGGLLIGVLLLPPLASGGCGPVSPDYSDLPQKKLEEVYPESVRVHVVRQGETLTRIAREYGVGIASIVQRNPGLDPDRIRVGQKIILPPNAKR